jgi:hypothetical protein
MPNADYCRDCTQAYWMKKLGSIVQVSVTLSPKNHPLKRRNPGTKAGVLL